LRYQNAQTRLFGVHKEQQGASREQHAPRGPNGGSGSWPETRTCQPRLYLGFNFARLLMQSAFAEFFVKTNRNYQDRRHVCIADDCVWSGAFPRQVRVAVVPKRPNATFRGPQGTTGCEPRTTRASWSERRLGLVVRDTYMCQRNYLFSFLIV
jgi:hypothetical protein